MKNKILFLTYWYPTKEKKSFGIFIKRHAHALHDAHELVVLAFLVHHSSSLFKLSCETLRDEENLQTHYIHVHSRFNKLIYVLLPLHYFIIRRYIKKNIRKNFPFTVVHSNILFPCAIIGHKLARQYGCRHVITEHWSKLDKFFSRSIYRSFGKKALHEASAITCVSYLLKNKVSEYTRNQNLMVVPNVVDSQHFFYDPSIKKNDQFTFIAVAHWNAPKNPFAFLEALSLLNAEQPGSFCLTLVGEGPLLEKVKSANYAFKINYIPALSPAELRIKLNESHAFLHGSDYETFSVVIAEALMCGIPVIANPVGIAPEVIHEGNGMIARNVAKDWFNCITSLKGKTYDQEKIAAEIKSKFDRKVVSKIFSDLYSQQFLNTFQ